MRAPDFLDGLNDAGAAAALRRLDGMSGDERNELRGETIRRLAAGELSPATAVAVLPSLGVEPAVPELVRLLRSAAPVPVRAAALVLLRRHTTYAVEREAATLDPESLPELLEKAIALRHAAQIASQKGTPFERLSLADREDPDFDEIIDEIIDELLDAFCASPEASAGEDPAELQSWASELVRMGVGYGHGSPAVWDAGTIDEIVTELLPRKLTIGSAAEAEGAVPAFRTFFRWVSRVAPMVDTTEIDAALDEYEADFPSMMMDERRFGPAKSFLLKGTAAGFDMSTEEGLATFTEYYNRGQGAVATGSRRKLDAAKKRKAKMAKLSRRKNRRKK